LTPNRDPENKREREAAGDGREVRDRLASLREDRHAARLASPTGEGQAGSPECGAMVAIQVQLDGDRVQAASFQAYGCPATLACAAEAVRLVEGRTLFEAALVGERTLVEALSLPEDKWSRAGLAVDALHAALGQALVRTARCESTPQGVLVGMSGGVDSNVAALLLKQNGYRPVGATLKLWTATEEGRRNICCSDEAVRRARRIAHQLGIPHFTLDARDLFFTSVVQYFIDEYAAGRTPNPCVKCNARLRFGLLATTARRLGLSRIATGHYARLTGNPPRLSRALCLPKDQSYVVAEVAPELLEITLFPLGELDKSTVRELAREAGLEGHDAPESQEICFVPEEGHRAFLRQHIGARPGMLVDTAGRTLGQHTGTYNFTVGQRRGHGVAAPHPLYVIRIDPTRDEVVLGPRDQLAVMEIVLKDAVVHRPNAPTQGLVQTRSSGQVVPGVATWHKDQVVIRLTRPAFGVAPGQTGVLYHSDDVVLAGTIIETRGSQTTSLVDAAANHRREHLR